MNEPKNMENTGSTYTTPEDLAKIRLTDSETSTVQLATNFALKSLHCDSITALTSFAAIFRFFSQNQRLAEPARIAAPTPNKPPVKVIGPGFRNLW